MSEDNGVTRIALVAFSPRGGRREISMPSGRYVVGRHQEANLRLPIASVSRRHCVISREGDTLSVNDLGSSNGTFCNGERIDGERALSAGDVIEVGPCRFMVQVDGEPADLPETPEPAPAPDEALAATPPEGAPAVSAENSDLEETITKAGLGSLLEAEESSVFDFDFDLDDDENPKL